MRNRYLQIIAMHGLVAWQKVAGHNRRALVEVDISRFNRVYRRWILIAHRLASRDRSHDC